MKNTLFLFGVLLGSLVLAGCEKMIQKTETNMFGDETKALFEEK